MGLRADRCADPRGGELRKIVRGGERAGEKTPGLYCTYRFKAILLLWVSAFFAMLYFPFFVSVKNYFTFVIQRIQH